MTRLRDGGRLVRMHDRSHVAYSIAEPGGMRLVLDGITCMFTNEYDPTQLRASMSGKLAKYGILVCVCDCVSGSVFDCVGMSLAIWVCVLS